MARILISDDEPAIGSVYQQVLERESQHKVCWAAGGLATLDMLEREQFDLLTTDLSNPSMDGFTLVTQVGVRFPKLPIVIITFSHDTQLVDYARSLSPAIRAYVRRPPFNPAAMLEAFRYALTTDWSSPMILV